MLSSIIKQQNKLSASSAHLCEIQAVETVKYDVEAAPAPYWVSVIKQRLTQDY